MSRTDARPGIWAFVAPPLLWLMLDRLAMGLIDDHLLSIRMLAAVPLLPGIIAEASSGFWTTLALEIVIWFLICIAIAWLASRLLEKPMIRRRLMAGSCLVWLAIICQGFLDSDDAKFLDREDANMETSARKTEIRTDSELREDRIRRIGFTQVCDVPPDLPDILIVVLESLRHELVDPEVMPNLAAAADQGLWCKEHFSGGNATSHGLFSIVTGMDATWFDTSLRYQPPLYRLFQSAGYEIGFFAGHDDWRKFYMDGFVTAEHFDAFAISAQKGLESDRRSILAATKFLERAEVRPPRLAVLYLYVTHAPYRSYAQDRIFEPASKDGFLIPYSKDAVSRVWNRYKNSARTADRWIGSMMSPSANRMMVITGDHGESFLEDGTIGHGSKISVQQNMTPAILVGPGVPCRQINAPTIHSDLLPTIMAAIGIRLSDSSQSIHDQEPLLDGRNLLGASEMELSHRTNVTCDYLTENVRKINDF